MSLNNKTASFNFIPCQQPPISCARDLTLPKRTSKNVKWERSGRYKPTRQKKSKKKDKQVATTALDAATPSVSSSIASKSASRDTGSCQLNQVTVNSLDMDDSMLVAALLACDPSIALVLNDKNNQFQLSSIQ